jgi:hypothetical protein
MKVRGSMVRENDQAFQSRYAFKQIPRDHGSPLTFSFFNCAWCPFCGILNYDGPNFRPATEMYLLTLP